MNNLDDELSNLQIHVDRDITKATSRCDDLLMLPMLDASILSLGLVEKFRAFPKPT